MKQCELEEDCSDTKCESVGAQCAEKQCRCPTPPGPGGSDEGCPNNCQDVDCALGLAATCVLNKCFCPPPIILIPLPGGGSRPRPDPSRGPDPGPGPGPGPSRPTDGPRSTDVTSVTSATSSGSSTSTEDLGPRPTYIVCQKNDDDERADMVAIGKIISSQWAASACLFDSPLDATNCDASDGTSTSPSNARTDLPEKICANDQDCSGPECAGGMMQYKCKEGKCVCGSPDPPPPTKSCESSEDCSGPECAGGMQQYDCKDGKCVCGSPPTTLITATSTSSDTSQASAKCSKDEECGSLDCKEGQSKTCKDGNCECKDPAYSPGICNTHIRTWGTSDGFSVVIGVFDGKNNNISHYAEPVKHKVSWRQDLGLENHAKNGSGLTFSIVGFRSLHHSGSRWPSLELRD